MNVIDIIDNYLLNNRKRILTVLLSSFIVGVLSHGSIMFNNYAFFDNADLFNIGCTYELGRWFLGVMTWMTMYVSGSLLYTTPLFNTIITILSIAVICYLVIDLFNINKSIEIVIFCGLMEAFPAVTSALGYMFTAPYYYFGLLIGVFGIYIYFKRKNLITYIFAVVLLACGAGTYQANMSLFVGILLLLTINNIANSSGSLKSFLLEVTKNGGLCILMLLVYLLCNKVAIFLTGIDLVSYKGTSEFMNVSFSEYLIRLTNAYKEFFVPVDCTSRNMYPFSLLKFYKILIIIVVVLLIIFLSSKYKESLNKGLQLTFLCLFIPLACNFVYLMCDIEFVYSIMMYGETLIFIILLYLINALTVNIKLYSYIKYCVYVLLIVFSVLYIKFDNDCYLKADIIQNQIKSYITTLVTQIKSVDGYSDGMKICFVGEGNKTDLSIPYVENLDSIYIHPFHMNSLIYDYNFRRIMQRQIGFYPERLESEDLENTAEVKDMPCYPNSGSIKIVNDVVVVKFS